jgi:deazaflavin-dependent oxidoreductase (nitroreductase family)
MPKPPPPPGSPKWKLMNGVTKLNTLAFRASKGRIGGRFGKAPILLLHHVGARSGANRVTPLIYLADGDDLVLVASKGGSDQNPGWLHNLRAHPDAEVELGHDRRPVRARVASEDEKARYWPQLVDMYKGYADYQTFTERQIPLVVLEPR